jgi:hypothetical protein
MGVKNSPPPSNSLTISHPELAAQWHPTLNPRSVESVSAGSDYRAVWICIEEDHTWESTVSNRVRGRGCPYCAGKSVLAGFNDLSTTNPELAGEWHPTLNGDLTPKTVNAGSHKKIVWVCSSSSHKWTATVASRAKAGSGCPFCAGQLAQSGVSDIATTNPELAKEWHPALNGDLTPSQLLSGSNRSVYWHCSSCGHDWRAAPATRLRSGCPACAGKVTVPGFNDLATTNPDLAAQWHPTLNGNRTPQSLMRGSNFMATWICQSHGHVWRSTVSNRSSKGYGCPVCSRKQVQSGFNDLATTNPDLAAQWHPTLNGDLNTVDVIAGSDRQVYWLCPTCGHSWATRLTARSSKEKGCPVCAGQAILEGFNDFETTHPHLAKEWHPQLNPGLTPRQVTAGTHKKVFWLCPAYGHTYKSALGHRASGKGCPICAGRQVLVGFNDLETTNPKLADQWHPTLNGELTPRMVTSGSSNKIWWACEANGHQWQAAVSGRHRGNGCPICAGQVVLPGFNDLYTTHPEIAAQWHPILNGEKRPDSISGGSRAQIWWVCPDNGHEYRSRITARTYMKTGCPTCAQYGFDASKPGILYFIEHKTLAARKIGITNVGKRRLASFTRSGWVKVLVEEREQGYFVRDVETAVLTWIRKEHALPQFLGKEDMGKEGGWTETFSQEGPTNLEVVEKIRLEFGKLENTET